VIFAHLIQSASNLPTDASALESSISALESEIKTLESSSVPWEYSVWVFTFLVAVGVVMELLVIRHEYRDDMEAWALAHFGVLRSPSMPSITKLSVEVGSVLLITMGIMGELGVGIKIASINGALRGKSAELRSKSDLLLGLVTQEAAELRNDAEGLHEQAESEHLMRVKIEAGVAWRRLTEQQKTEIGDSLKRFSNQGVSFWSNAGDVEASWFAADIAEAITKAETLRVYAPAQFISAMEGGSSNLGKPIRHADTGVVVGYTPYAPSQLLADAIVKELTTRGFDAVTRKNESKQPIAPQVAVQVEARPEGPQGEFKLQAEQEAKAKKTKSKP
jgi:hypothetical protein